MFKRMFALVGLVALFVPQLVFADGMIIIDPPQPDPFPLRVKYHEVDTTIVGTVAETKIDQVFVNPTDTELEGTYLFPVPEGAAISKFSLYLGEEEVSGEIKDAAQARQIYEEYVRNQQDPALLQYIDQGLLQARVYPIEPQSEKRIKLNYTEEFTVQDGVYKYIYPLNTEQFSAGLLDHVRITVQIEAPAAIKSVYSPTHEITIERSDDTHAVVTYEAEQVKPDTDFVLYYTTSHDPFGANVFTYDDGNEKFFMLLMAPDYAADGQQIVPKDVVFILDTSGSMGEDGKLDQAKGALNYCLRHLNAGDRFDVLAYADTVHMSLVSGVPLLEVSDETISYAQEQVNKLEDNGSTNIYDALAAGLAALQNATTEVDGRLKIVVFLTDGLPTVGTTDVDAILAHAREENEAVQARIFAFGVGNDVNTNLLDTLSRENKAISEYVQPTESIETKVSSLYNKIANPVLSDVSLTFDDALGVKSLYPSAYPDFFQGSQLVLIGKYDKEKDGTIVLTGKVGSEEKRFAYRLDFSQTADSNHFIARLWATRRIGDLMDQIRLNGENEELVNEIVRLSKKYGIITQYTSFLVDVDITQDEETLLKDAQGYWDENARQYELDADTGSQAVNNAAGTQSMFQQNTPTAPGELAASDEQLQKIAQRNNKTFYLQNGRWIDADYQEDNVISIKQYSQAYFDFVRTNAELGDYVALGGEVAINYDGKNYVISESGQEVIASSELPAPKASKRGVKDITGFAVGTVVVAIIMGVAVGVLFRKKDGKEREDTNSSTKHSRPAK
jgi:Ca-activated chloride channel family protein